MSFSLTVVADLVVLLLLWQLFLLLFLGQFMFWNTTILTEVALLLAPEALALFLRAWSLVLALFSVVVYDP